MAKTKCICWRYDAEICKKDKTADEAEHVGIILNDLYRFKAYFWERKRDFMPSAAMICRYCGREAWLVLSVRIVPQTAKWEMN